MQRRLGGQNNEIETSAAETVSGSNVFSMSTDNGETSMDDDGETSMDNDGENSMDDDGEYQRGVDWEGMIQNTFARVNEIHGNHSGSEDEALNLDVSDGEEEEDIGPEEIERLYWTARNPFMQELEQTNCSSVLC